MNLNIFLNIVGIIGTWIGAISTLIAVIIAYKQLIQPTIAKIEIGGFVTQKLDPPQPPIFHIRFFNNYIKTVFIENVGYSIDDIFIAFPSKDTKFEIIGKEDNFDFPYALDNNVFIDVSIDYNLLKRLIKSILRDYNKDVNSKIRFAYTDCYNQNHYSKSISIKNFFKIYDKIYDQ